MFRISKYEESLYKPPPACCWLGATPHTCQPTHAFSCRKIKKHAFPTESLTLSDHTLPHTHPHTQAHMLVLYLSDKTTCSLVLPTTVLLHAYKAHDLIRSTALLRSAPHSFIYVFTTFTSCLLSFFSFF